MLKKVSKKSLFKLVLSFIGRIIIEKIDFGKSPKNGQKVKGLTASILQCSILNEEPCKWISQERNNVHFKSLAWGWRNRHIKVRLYNKERGLRIPYAAWFCGFWLRLGFLFKIGEFLVSASLYNKRLFTNFPVKNTYWY